jgi:hypothetical protein
MMIVYLNESKARMPKRIQRLISEQGI